MEAYLRDITLKNIVELFSLFFIQGNRNFSKHDYSYLDSYLNLRVSKRVKHEMLDYYKDFLDKNLISTDSNQEFIQQQIKDKVQLLYKELTKSQKIELYISILSYVIENEIIDVGENKPCCLSEQLEYVENVFELPSEDIFNITAFLRDNLEVRDVGDSIIVIGDFKRFKLHSFQMYQKDGLKGKIFALYVSSIKSFLIKYSGKNKIQINGRVVFPEKCYRFSLGGVIESSDMDPLFFGDLERKFISKEQDSYELDAYRLCKNFKGTNLGVKELSFKVVSGQLMAVMGGSGSGKTTLFSLLSGMTKPDAGKVFLNGNELHGNINKLKKHIGFVPQEDLLIEELTVFQNLKYSTQLCRSDLSLEEIEELVNDTLSQLGLSKIKDLKVGNPLDKVISGGQRKRLNIALEVVRNPNVLFVDEPTSGLSSSDALLVVKLLKQISASGSIVIINVHQPTSELFFLFDTLLILDENGYAAYYGNPITASSYFKKHLGLADSIEDDSLNYGQYNPEHIFELLEYKQKSDSGDLLNDRAVKNIEWHELFLKKSREKELKLNPKDLGESNTCIPGSFKQFLLFFKRNSMTRLADPQYLLLIFSGAPILAFIMSYFLKFTDGVTHKYSFIENDNIPAYLFISVVVALFLGLILSASEIHRDLKIIKRESFLSLSPWSYVNSKVFYVSIVNFIQVLLFVLVGNTILEIKGLFWGYVLILWITAFSSSLIGLLISASLKSILSIYITIPFLLIPQILLAGAILDFDKIHHSLSSKRYVPVYADVNISRWAYEALVMLQFTENKYDAGLTELQVKQSKAIYHANLFLPKLETTLSEFQNDSSMSGAKEINQMIKELTIQFPEIQNEFANIKIEPGNVHQLYKSTKKIKKWLRFKLKGYYSDIEKIREENTRKYSKQDYYNQKLSEFVLKSNDYKKYLYIGGEMIRKFQPGYYISANRYGRSHYYAPYKKLGSILVRTWIFNVCIVALFSLIIYFSIIIYLYRKKF